MLHAFVGHRFLIEEAVRDHLREAGLEPRGVPRVDEEVTPERVLENLQGGLFGPASVIVDVEGVKDYKALLEALATAPDAHAVVLDPENWAPDDPASEVTRKRKAQEARARVYEKHGSIHLIPTPQKGALIRWTERRAQSMGLRLTKDAGEVLSAIFPNDPPAIAGELEKLASLDGPLDADAVRRVVNHLPPTTVFQVLEDAARRRPARAAEHLGRLLDAGEDPFRLMAALVNHYALGARVRGIIDQDPSVRPDEVGRILNIHAFRAEKSMQAVRDLPEPRLRESLGAILEADVSMKSGLDPSLTLERLVLRLAGAA